MKIAIIGTGIAGNVAAYHLAREHEITVYEANPYVGGHTHTIDLQHDGQQHRIDTGFIVFNDRTYPNFVRLLDQLGVGWQDSDMSFSVQDELSGLEYKGSTLNTLFAQRRNLFSPRFHRMIRDILRFNREAPSLLAAGAADISLDDYLEAGRYSRQFIDQFIIPMGAAIWSAKPKVMGKMPAHFFVRFFYNHGLLSVNDHPQWRVIRGGSSRYVDKLVAGHREKIRLNTPVQSVSRRPAYVEVTARGLETERFDHVFFACHSDQALHLLSDPSSLELDVLGAIEFQLNEAVLHTDSSVLPQRRLAWAAWNYHKLQSETDRVALTYNMNILQGIDTAEQFCVTLNNTAAVNPEKILHQQQYSHPVFTPRAVRAQQMHSQINGGAGQGPARSWFCGAYWGYGFHEDGVVSALAALEHFNERRADA